MRRIRRLHVASMAQQAMRAPSGDLVSLRLCAGVSRHARLTIFEANGIGMRAVVAGLARAAVSALVKSDPSVPGIAAAGSAIDKGHRLAARVLAKRVPTPFLPLTPFLPRRKES